MISVPGWRAREARWLALLSWLVVGLFCLMPVASLVTTALWRPAGAGLDVSGLWTAWTSRSALTALGNTVLIGAVSGLGATALGTTVAVTLWVTDVRGRRAIALLLVGALLVAPQVMALAFKTLAGPASPLLLAVGLAPPPGTSNPMLGLGGVILALTLHHVALAAMTVATGLGQIPRSLIEAAEIDGAHPWTIVRRIVLPLVRPQIAASFVLTFVAGAGNFGIPVLLGLPAGVQTLPTLIYRQLTGYGPGVLPDVAALSLLAAALALAGIAFGRWIGSDATPLVGDGDRIQPFWRLGLARPVIEGVLASLVLAATLLPLVSLAATALVPAAGVRLTLETVTLANLREVLFVQGVTTRALQNSLVYATAAGLLCALLGLALAYAIERAAVVGRTALALFVQLPYAIPGVVLAIAAILLLLKPLPLVGVSLYATPWIIILAYVARFLAVAVTPIGAQVAQMDPDLEAAATVFGASLVQRVRHIVAPLALPALATAHLLVMLLAFNELTVSALLWSAGTETLGVALLSLEDAGLIGEAAALGLVTTVIVAILIAAIDRVAAWLPPGALPWATLAGQRP